MRSLLLFLPDEFLMLLLLGAGLAAILGVLPSGVFWGLAIAVVVMALATPIVEAFVGSLPAVWQLLILLGLGIVLARSVLALLLGRGATDRFVAHLAYDIFVLPFRLFGLLLRGIFAGRRRAERWR